MRIHIWIIGFVVMALDAAMRVAFRAWGYEVKKESDPKTLDMAFWGSLCFICAIVTIWQRDA